MYSIQSPGQVVIVDHSKLVYFDATRAGSRLALDDASILPALGDAMQNVLRVRHSENIVERVARYMNQKMLAVEKVVSEHPWATLSLFAAFVLVVFWMIRRLFDDEPASYKSGKAARLD